MAEETKPLSAKEYDAISQGLFEKISEYGELPKGAKLDYQSLDEINHIGFLTMPGGKYTKEYVTGGFEAQLPFQILYKAAPTGNSQYYNAEKLVNGIADYLEENPGMELSDGREIVKISMDSTTYRSNAGEDGSVVFVRNGVIKYEKV